MAATEPESPSKRLTDEQAELAGEHWEKAMQLAKAHAKKFPRLDFDWESAAAIGLCDAASRFDPEHKVGFWTFASHRVKFSFLDLMRTERLKGYGRGHFADKPDVYSMDAVLAYNPADGTRKRSLTWHDVTPSDEMPTGWEEQSFDFVYGETQRLSGPARDVIRLYYCHGLSMKQAGERLGLSESRVSQLHKQAIEFLREALHPESIAC